MKCLSILVAIVLVAAVSPAADVLTQHNDLARSGAILDEKFLTTTTVAPGKFGRLWNLYADGQIVAQPLYVANLVVDTSSNPDTPLVQGTFNAVVVATMHNTIYVYDADKSVLNPDGHTKPLWARWLNVPRPGGKDIDMWSTNDPEWGIVSTPVISPDRSTLFVVSWHSESPADFRYRLHAIDLKSGSFRTPSVVIGVPSSDPSNPCHDQSAYNPCLQKQRMALALHNNVIYAGFGGDGNRGTLFAFNAANLAEIARWLVTPTGKNGGLWQSGQAPAVDPAGNVYIATGNGDFNANSGGANYGNSVVKLKLESGAFVVKDYFTPCNLGFLNGKDLDLGSGGPVLLPSNPPRLVVGGKEGVLYSLPLTGMGNHVPSTAPAGCPNAAAVQSFLAFPAALHGTETHHGNIHGSPVFWTGPDATRIYVWGENNTLHAYRTSNGAILDTTAPRESAFRPPDGMPGGMLSLSANGNKAGTGIVWAIVPLNGDANTQRGVTGILLALDAQDVSRTLWTSEMFSQRDRVGLFPKFTPPTVANGKVFVPTYGDAEPLRVYPKDPPKFPAKADLPKQYYVAVYGALPAPPPVITDQSKNDISVVRASTSADTIDPTRCTPIDATSLDCTNAVTAAAGGAPAFHRVVLGSGTNLAGCTLLRVVTASRTGALTSATATGTGFWSASVTNGNQAAENSGLFVPLAQLKTAGTAIFLDNSPATLHEFSGIANCSPGTGQTVGRLFKPFMQFETGGNKIFRNWDAADNFLIDTANPAFDRSSDVLKP